MREATIQQKNTKVSPNTIHFEISERKILLRVLDVLMVVLTLFLVGEFFSFDYINFAVNDFLWMVVLLTYLLVFSAVFELYDIHRISRLGIVVKNIVLAVSVTVLCYILTPYYTPMLPTNRMEIIFFWLAIITGLLISRFLYNSLISAPRFYKRILIVGDSNHSEEICSFLQGADPNFKVVAFYDTAKDQKSTSLQKLKIPFLQIQDIEDRIIEWRISEIVVAAPTDGGMTKELTRELMKLMEKGVPIRDYVQVYEEMMRRIPVKEVERDFYIYFPFSRSNNNKLYLFFSRVLDVLFSLVGLLGLMLLLPFVLIGNLLGNRGPLFYHQTRVGKNGVPFRLYKFRSMVVDAEKDGVQFAQVRDARITKFGRFLRLSRLDEIPQFINVLLGHMSIIGPRPERPEFVTSLSEKIPFYEVRHVIKPGITGWAQVNAKYGASEDDALEKIQYDLYYIKHRGLFIDLSIVLKTLSTIVFFRGQ